MREVLPLLRPFDAEAMKWAVGKAVGSVKNDSAELLVPVGDEGAGHLF